MTTPSSPSQQSPSPSSPSPEQPAADAALKPSLRRAALVVLVLVAGVPAAVAAIVLTARATVAPDLDVSLAGGLWIWIGYGVVVLSWFAAVVFIYEFLFELAAARWPGVRTLKQMLEFVVAVLAALGRLGSHN